MNDPKTDAPEHEPSREDKLSALFAHMVMQQSNMAMMLMGKMPHPETGKTFQDIEAARLFIDQLEMLEAKTKGNLSRHEESLLKQSLMTLRLAFVEAVDHPGAQPESESAAAKPMEGQTAGAPGTTPANPAPANPAPEEESKKKFTKKY